ncbi:LCP family protein [Dactylosporangium salmoneum]|uniref:Cell envelope-related transcriptional attenuator domain-containing protein n=1 Tax=Dactylosporangium salmoneum TaxID=53361 RepID=A0ABN3I011_9ACTN
MSTSDQPDQPGAPASTEGGAVPEPDGDRPPAVPRHRAPVWAKLCIVVGVVLTLMSGVALVGKQLLFSYATHSVAQENLLGDTGTRGQQRGHVDITGAKNILLIGIDARPDQDPTEPVRADSILILHIPADHNAAFLISIPRDTWVKIPPYNNGAKRFAGGHDKINGAYAAGGAGLTGANQRAHAVELLALTIKSLWGVTFDGAAIVDFTGFQQVVAVLGGIDMYVDEETTSIHVGYDAKGEVKVPYRQYTRSDGGQGLSPIPGVTPFVYHVGYQHLEPWQALDYVRQRELLPNSDYDRQRHQQQFLKALFKKLLSRDVLTNPVQLNQVLQVVGKAMTIDSGGIDLADWAYAMRGIGGDDLLTIKTNNGTFNNDPGNRYAEALDQTTLDLLAAVRTEQVPAFIAAHPELVAPS